MRGYDIKTEQDMSAFQQMPAEINTTFQAISSEALLLFRCKRLQLNILIAMGSAGVTNKEKKFFSFLLQTN